MAQDRIWKGGARTYAGRGEWTTFAEGREELCNGWRAEAAVGVFEGVWVQRAAEGVTVVRLGAVMLRG